MDRAVPRLSLCCKAPLNTQVMISMSRCGMAGKAAAAATFVVVDDPQGMEPHVVGSPDTRQTRTVFAIEPTKISVATSAASRILVMCHLFRSSQDAIEQAKIHKSLRRFVHLLSNDLYGIPESWRKLCRASQSQAQVAANGADNDQPQKSQSIGLPQVATTITRAGRNPEDHRDRNDIHGQRPEPPYTRRGGIAASDVSRVKNRPRVRGSLTSIVPVSEWLIGL